MKNIWRMMVLSVLVAGTALAQQPRGVNISYESAFKLSRIESQQRSLGADMQAAQQAYASDFQKIQMLSLQKKEVETQALKDAGKDPAKFHVAEQDAKGLTPDKPGFDASTEEFSIAENVAVTPTPAKPATPPSNDKPEKNDAQHKN